MAKQRSATNTRSLRTFLLVQQFAAAEIGARIAQARRENDAMTQQQLAELLDVSTRAVQNYEAGIHIPWKHFKRLEAIFDRELAWFLYGEEPEGGDLVQKIDEINANIDRLLRGVMALLVQQVGAETAEAELAVHRASARAAEPPREATG